jgi:AbrB family looped-hinge helix DNA binding protein
MKGSKNMKIGERGQVTIPKDIREQYGLLPNIEVEFIQEKYGILIVKKIRDMSPVEQVYGILKKNENTDNYIEAIRGR